MIYLILMIISDTTIHYYESVRVDHFHNYFITSEKIHLEKFSNQCRMYVGVVYINFVDFFCKTCLFYSHSRKYSPRKKKVCDKHFSSCFISQCNHRIFMHNIPLDSCLK